MGAYWTSGLLAMVVEWTSVGLFATSTGSWVDIRRTKVCLWNRRQDFYGVSGIHYVPANHATLCAIPRDD